MRDTTEILGLVLNSGILGYLFFYDSRKRKESAEARGLELKNIDKILLQKDGYIEDLKLEYSELKKEFSELKIQLNDSLANEAKERDKVVTLYKQLSNVNIKNVKLTEQIAIAKFQKCLITNCEKRIPAHEFSENENNQ